MQNSEVVLKFVSKINSHDVPGLVSLMTEDHLFVDSLGSRFVRPAIEEGWRQYFAMVPDYWVRVERVISDTEVSVLIGEAGGTFVPKGGRPKLENRWSAPSAWVARTREGRVSEWRVFSDNEPIRSRMRQASASP